MSLDDGLTTASEQPEDRSLHYPNVYVFVSEFLALVYARHYEPAGSWRWCSTWWEHPEAVSRLDALWLAFEALRQEPGTGPATWWRDYCDPTMSALTEPSGPFAQCRAGERHEAPTRLPTTTSPVGLTQTTTSRNG